MTSTTCKFWPSSRDQWGREGLLWEKESWILHQGNAADHSALAMKQFIADRCTLGTPTPPPPPWLLSVPKVNSALKETHFKSVHEMKRKTLDLLNTVSWCLQYCSEHWEFHMQWCIVQGGGGSVEEDNLNLYDSEKKNLFSTPVPLSSSRTSYI
jgi:hypothetical protein